MLKVPYRLEFSIDGLPPLPNRIMYRHWAIKRKSAAVWKAAVFRAVKFLSKVEPKLKKAKITLTRHSSRECDFDNLAASFKHVIDGLVEANVIEDDNQRVIGCPVFIWKKCKRNEQKITILVEEILDGEDSKEIKDQGQKETSQAA